MRLRIGPNVSLGQLYGDGLCDAKCAFDCAVSGIRHLGSIFQNMSTKLKIYAR